MSSILRYLSPLNFRIITSEQEERQEKQPTSLDEKTVQAFIASQREQTEVQRKELAVREKEIELSEKQATSIPHGGDTLQCTFADLPVLFYDGGAAFNIEGALRIVQGWRKRRLGDLAPRIQP